MVLDQVRLKSQGLRFAVGDDEFDPHTCLVRRMRGEIVSAAEVAANATAQAFDLPT